ncbi:MAG: hypothetical protein JRJ44_09510 [Deltaproteobacteria bacterium]|nr:hypothetical protein [Deltaproteobacteria bacterium]
MKCYDCKGNYIEKKGSISLNNHIIGDFEVYNVTYYKCSNCNKLLFPNNTAIKIEKKENEIKLKLLCQLPVQDFVSASDAAYLLDISRQAFHKNIRIKNGFIYSIELGGKRLYNKKSILLFKEKGDGRFSLNKVSAKKSKYIVILASYPDEIIWNKTNMANRKSYIYITD